MKKNGRKLEKKKGEALNKVEKNYEKKNRKKR